MNGVKKNELKNAVGAVVTCEGLVKEERTLERLVGEGIRGLVFLAAVDMLGMWRGLTELQKRPLVVYCYYHPPVVTVFDGLSGWAFAYGVKRAIATYGIDACARTVVDGLKAKGLGREELRRRLELRDVEEANESGRWKLLIDDPDSVVLVSEAVRRRALGWV